MEFTLSGVNKTHISPKKHLKMTYFSSCVYTMFHLSLKHQFLQNQAPAPLLSNTLSARPCLAAESGSVDNTDPGPGPPFTFSLTGLTHCQKPKELQPPFAGGNQHLFYQTTQALQRVHGVYCDNTSCHGQSGEFPASLATFKYPVTVRYKLLPEQICPTHPWLSKRLSLPRPLPSPPYSLPPQHTKL